MKRNAVMAPNAIKVDVDVKRFWVWAESNPQVRRSYYFSSQIEATIQADAPPFGLPSLVGADIRARGKRPKDDVSWIRTGNRGIEDFIKNVATLLKYPPAGTINQ